MNILHSPEDLVDEKLDVVVAKLLGFDDVVQVRAHEVSHQVDVRELAQVLGGAEHIQKANNLERAKR